MIAAFLTKLRVRDDVSAEEEAALRQVLQRTREYPAGQCVVRAGDEVTHCMLLIRGYACRSRHMADGARQILELNIPGDFVDLHGMLLLTLDHDIETFTPCTFALTPHEDVRQLTRDFPHVSRLLWLQTVLDAAIHREWVTNLGSRPALGRIAHFFVEQQVRLQVIGLATDEGFELPLTQQDIAECAGLTPVHVNRTLKVLRERRLATFRRGRVEIHDLDGLKAEAEWDPTYLSLHKRPR